LWHVIHLDFEHRAEALQKEQTTGADIGADVTCPTPQPPSGDCDHWRRSRSGASRGIDGQTLAPPITKNTCFPSLRGGIAEQLALHVPFVDCIRLTNHTP
jgi:hypothetical protein